MFDFSRISLDIVTLTFIFPAVLFVSVIGLWAIRPLGPGVPGSDRGGLIVHGIGPRLDQSLVGHSHNLNVTLTPANLIVWTDCR